jgi:hypothetical protein
MDVCMKKTCAHIFNEFGAVKPTMQGKESLLVRASKFLLSGSMFDLLTLSIFFLKVFVWF